MSQIIISMTGILLCLVVLLFIMSLFLQVKSNESGTWLPSNNNIAKRQFEVWALTYSAIWIGCFGLVIVTQAYERFTENGYMALCVTLASPLLLQPILFPLEAERNLPLYLRYSFKANVWIAIFSFIGNYWYTHYFYSVLQAKYTFPAHRINGVPISMFFATHFYFVTYHTFSNLMLRKIETRYNPSIFRTIFFWMTVCIFAYFTAFMETLTISSFPYYSFPAPLLKTVYTLGSAFYGIYFIVSFPVFYRLDEKVNMTNHIPPHSVYQTVIEAMGAGMIVLILLDLARLALGIPLVIKGNFYEVTKLGQSH